MRLRVRLKSLVLLGLVSSCLIFYNFAGLHFGGLEVDNARGRRVARITASDLVSIGRYSEPPPPLLTSKSTGRSVFGTQPVRNSSFVNNHKFDPSIEGHYLSSISGGIGGTGLLSQPPLVGPLTRPEEIKNLELNGGKRGVGVTPKYGSSSSSSSSRNPVKNQTPCDGGCQFRRLREQSLAALAQIRAKKANATKNGNMGKFDPCDQACRIAKMKNRGSRRGGYSSRVQVENVTLPDSWTVTRELVDRLSSRRNHVHEVCHRYGLNKPSKTYQPNAWEFLVNAKYGLVWCNVFKAASSTWFYNFNLLAGFSEQELLHAKETPIQIARKRYPRPTVEELHKAMNATPQPLSFMIARHPFERLVSGYRDKILSGNRYYSKLSRTILRHYKDMGPGEENDNSKVLSFFGKSAPMAVVPSFSQFVQFLLDESARGRKLDEHWIPMNQFCTPCLVDFDVFAKVETMEEDGNYIIFSAGIQDVIKPKRINRSRNEPTDTVADKFLCQLSESQMDGLVQLYKYDIELFEYDVSKYIRCTRL